MQLPEPLHRWDVRGEDAVELQKSLRRRLKHIPLPSDVKLVGGADMALSKKHGLFFAAFTVLALPELEVVEVQKATVESSYPYVPGLLSFREGPAVINAYKKLNNPPDVVIFDGQGIAHPRGLGLAAHMGLFLNIPTIGCAKSRLWGEYKEPGIEKGDWEPLQKDGRMLGAVLRSRRKVKPIFVSPGHLCDVGGARELTLRCAVRYRLPEPVREAHRRVSEMKRDFIAEKDKIR